MSVDPSDRPVLCELGHSVPPGRECPVCGGGVTGDPAPLGVAPRWYNRHPWTMAFGVILALAATFAACLLAAGVSVPLTAVAFAVLLVTLSPAALVLGHFLGRQVASYRRWDRVMASAETALRGVHAPEASRRLLVRFSDLRFFRRGHTRRTGPIVQTRIDDREAIVGRFWAVRREGKHQYEDVDMFVVFPECCRLAEFELRPERFADRLGQKFAEDIDFDGSPTDERFSRKYSLQGRDVATIRSVFSASVRSALSDEAGWRIESAGDALLFSRPVRAMRSGLAKGLPAGTPTAGEVERLVRDAARLSALIAGGR